MNEERCRRLIAQALKTFELDLSGLIVLTESATGYYLLTPFIAALAGAHRVYALTRDSRYGSATKVHSETMDLANRWELDNQIQILPSREDERVREADIVTNLGFVRPLDKSLLQRLKTTAAIPLMWETWEFRSEDLDLNECRRLGIPVLGTNEHHLSLSIFGYIGHIALKLLLECELEVFRSRVVVLGSGEFAAQTAETLTSAGATVSILEGLQTDLAHRELQQADALIVVEHHRSERLIGDPGLLTAERLYALNPGLVLAHICGNVDRDALDRAGIRYRPHRIAPPGYMSVATDYVGPRPLVDLHTAGLKVGEILARARLSGLGRVEAELFALSKSTLCQGFPEE